VSATPEFLGVKQMLISGVSVHSGPLNQLLGHGSGRMRNDLMGSCNIPVVIHRYQPLAVYSVVSFAAISTMPRTQQQVSVPTMHHNHRMDRWNMITATERRDVIIALDLTQLNFLSVAKF